MKKSSEKIEALIRHEILNVMTNLRFLVEDEASFDLKTRADFLDRLAWASFLVAQPEAFLDQPAPLLLSLSPLQDLLEIVLLLQNKVHQKKLKYTPPKSNDMILTDKNRSKELLSALLRFLLENTHQVELSVKNNTLVLVHDEEIVFLPQKTPLETLSEAKMTSFERLLSCLLHQATALNLSISSKKNVLEVKFKST